MEAFQEITSMAEIESFINDYPLAFLYFYRTTCSVCHALAPQVKRMLEDYPQIEVRQINMDTVPEAAGRFNIFTVPVLLLHADGSEVLRRARIVPLDELNQQLNKITDAYSA